MTDTKGDSAFRASRNDEQWHEMTYGGALSFLRRRFTRDLSDVDVVVSGVPFDNAVSNRPGCRFGPRAIRVGSTLLAELDAFPFGFNLAEKLNIIDYGDCHIDPHHPAEVANTIENHAAHIIANGAKMLTFGGDHFVTYPLLKAHAKKYGPLALLQFDAHGDTWEDDGISMDHGTMFARAVAEGVIDAEHSIQIGIRTSCENTGGMKVLTASWVHRNGVDATLEEIHARLDGKPTYLTFDIDCLDPAFAPGTGTPVAGGLASWQALEIIRGLERENMVAMDVVEVSPAYDHAEITAIAAATLAHDWLSVMAQRKEN